MPNLDMTSESAISPASQTPDQSGNLAPKPFNRRLFRSLLTQGARLTLPSFLRRRALRSLLILDKAPTSRMALGMAQTQADLEACYTLVQATHAEHGLSKSQRKRPLHLTVWHTLPTTLTFFVKIDDEVVATATLVRDSELGLPAEVQFPLVDLRAKQYNLFELTGLAVRRDFRYAHDCVVWPLLHACFLYLREQADAALISMVNPRRPGVFEDLMQFSRRKYLDDMGNTKSVLVSSPVALCGVRCQTAYRGAPSHKDLHAYLFGDRIANNSTPPTRYRVTSPCVMTPALLDYFFNQRTNLLSRLPDKTLSLLSRLYPSDAYNGIFPRGVGDSGMLLRRSPRHDVSMCATLTVADGNENLYFPVNVVEVSSAGFLARCQTLLPVKCHGSVEVFLGPSDRSTGLFVLAMNSEEPKEVTDYASYTYGFRLLQPDTAWVKMIAALSSASTAQELAMATQFLPVEA